MPPADGDGGGRNPTLWRFTWETQSHHPTVKLFIFNPTLNPKQQCLDITVDSDPSRSVIQVSYAAAVPGDRVSLNVPAPNVLVDYDSPVSFRALDDHIEVKVPLLLPVDHPLSSFDEALRLAGDGGGKLLLDDSETLPIAAEVENLSAKGGIEFYCRSCLSKLTSSPIREFVEMPSVDWQEAADNWFGGCCCSFGGVSEKLVARYAKSYRALAGRCLLDQSAVTVCKDDLSGCRFPECSGALDFETSPSSDLLFEEIREQVNNHSLCCQDPELHIETAQIRKSEAGQIYEASNLHSTEICEHRCEASEIQRKCQEPERETELRDSQKSFLNGYLGNGFMSKSYNLSAKVEWVEFQCPHCSALLGAYPSSGGGGPFDGGVRMYKCYISTDLPVSGSEDIFKKYTFEKMFSHQILRNAKDELSFRTIIKDLQTRCPVMQMVLLNPNSWYGNGYCSGMVNLAEPSLKVTLCPAIKVLFRCKGKDTELLQEEIEQWTGRHAADEVFMLPCQIEALAHYLVSAKDLYPPSFTLLDGFHLSCICR